MTKARDDLLSLWNAALGAVDSLNAMAGYLAARPAGRLVVVGAGKAAARMALAAEQFYGPPLEGLVLTRYGHGAPTQWLSVVEAGHPMPDELGRDAALRILSLANALSEGDRLLLLLSGGGSALLSLPPDDVPFADKQAMGAALLRSGASIADINVVRKHVSRIKGGRLAAAAFPAETVTLAISDVPGDDASVIASGPSVPDPSTGADAQAIIARYAIPVSERVRLALGNPGNESIKPGDPRLARSTYHLIARPRDALDAAAREARARGYAVLDLGDRVEGEARDVAQAHAHLARQSRARRPLAIISGGELTVTGAAPDASGGRGREYALALALALGGEDGMTALAGDTDGIDGTADGAGALIFPDTLKRAAGLGLDAAQMLDQHRSGAFFAALGDALVTGPTRTNVGDLRIILLA